MMESLDHELTLAGYDGIYTTLVYPSSFHSTLYSKSRHLYEFKHLFLFFYLSICVKQRV